MGNRVIGTGRNHSVLAQMQEEHAHFTGIAADLRSPVSLQQLVETVQQQHAGINILINNAGIQHQYSWLDAAEAWEKIDEELNVNLVAPLKLTAALVPVLKSNPDPVVVNISSALAIVPKQSAPVYCASKAGLHIFSKALRYQLEKAGIQVMEVLPPLIDTPMTEGRHTGEETPESLTDQFIKAFQRNRTEINIGKTGKLRLLHRIAPNWADNILKNG